MIGKFLKKYLCFCITLYEEKKRDKFIKNALQRIMKKIFNKKYIKKNFI